MQFEQAKRRFFFFVIYQLFANNHNETRITSNCKTLKINILWEKGALYYVVKVGSEDIQDLKTALCSLDGSI